MQYTNGRPTCSWQRRREATINNRKHYCHFVTCPSPQYDCSVPSLPRESWMIYPGLQVDAGKRREEKIHSKRENVSIQSFSINEAEDFLNTSMKLNQIPTYRRGDRQLLCVFTAYSVLPDGTVILSRMRKVHLNKAGRAQHSSKPMEKLKDIFPISKRFSPYPHRMLCSLGIIIFLAEKQNCPNLPQIQVLIARSKESKAERMRGIRFRVRKFWDCFPQNVQQQKLWLPLKCNSTCIPLYEPQGHSCSHIHVVLVLFFMEKEWLQVSLQHTRKCLLEKQALKASTYPDIKR